MYSAPLWEARRLWSAQAWITQFLRCNYTTLLQRQSVQYLQPQRTPHGSCFVSFPLCEQIAHATLADCNTSVTLSVTLRHLAGVHSSSVLVTSTVDATDRQNAMLWIHSAAENYDKEFCRVHEIRVFCTICYLNLHDVTILYSILITSKTAKKSPSHQPNVIVLRSLCFSHIFTAHVQKLLCLSFRSTFWNHNWIWRPQSPIIEGYFGDLTDDRPVGRRPNMFSVIQPENRPYFYFQATVHQGRIMA